MNPALMRLAVIGSQVIPVNESGPIAGAELLPETGVTCSCPVPKRAADLISVRCEGCGKYLPSDRAQPPKQAQPFAGSVVERWHNGRRRKFVIQENGALRAIEGGK